MAGSSINAFVRSIRGYVTASVKNANVDRNPYLTKTEAKALPKDLRDNYETHRVLGNGNATVVARAAAAASGRTKKRQAMLGYALITNRAAAPKARARSR